MSSAKCYLGHIGHLVHLDSYIHALRANFEVDLTGSKLIHSLRLDEINALMPKLLLYLD